MTDQAINTNADFQRREAAEDIFFGQVVINWARWFVIAAGVTMVMILTTNETELTIGIVPIVGLMVVNFYLHGRRLAQNPANRGLIAISSVLDLALITTMIAVGPAPAETGLGSQFYVAYFPVIAAFGFVMPRRFTVAYVAAAMVAYTVTCLVVNTQILDGSQVAPGQLEGLITRLIVIAAVGGLASHFWRVQRERRHASSN
ncbi:MAG: hypothetical protein QF357_03940 [Dehalococcoidia bacterium]|jgi:hypothetical protein|nr:hypothetical protein [Dehalococcoidia bacterium]